VGKSCVVVTIGGKRVMFDCGMHMGHHDCQCYPDFARILSAAPGAADFTSAISCVVITHLYVGQMFLVPLSPIFFPSIGSSSTVGLLLKIVSCSHLDHIGALPYFTEVCGYNGPVYMTVSLILVVSAKCLCMLGFCHVLLVRNRCRTRGY
jgi:integrator complex subunit 11